MRFNDLSLRLYNIIIYEGSIMVGLKDIIICNVYINEYIKRKMCTIYESLINISISIYIFHTIIFEL